MGFGRSAFLFLGAFLVSSASMAEVFHAHASESADLLRPGQFSWLGNPGMQNTLTPKETTFSAVMTFANSSLNVGVFRWLSVGANPIYYMLPGAAQGIARIGWDWGPQWASSVGYSHLSFRSEFINLWANTFTFNNRFRLSPEWNFNGSTGTTHNYSIFGDTAVEKFSEPFATMDAEYTWTNSWRSVIGISWNDQTHPRDLLTVRRTFGVGTSVAAKTPRSWWLYPMIGAHYFPEFGAWQALISVYSH